MAKKYPCFHPFRADNRNRNRNRHLKRELLITSARIDERQLLAQRTLGSDMGAVIYFLGVVRGTEENRAIRGIEYEAFVQMVEHQFNLLFDAIEKKWPIQSVRLVHRIG